MPQIINETGLGASLGQSLGQGLQTLAALKAQQYQARQQAQRTEQGLVAAGYSPDEARALSGLDSSILGQLVKAKAQQPAQQEYARQLQAILGGSPEETPETQPIKQQLSQQQIQQPEFQQQNIRPQLPGLSNLFPQLAQQETPVERVTKPAAEQAQLETQHKRYGEPSPSQAQQLEKRIAEGKSVPQRPAPVLNEKQATSLAKIGLQKQALLNTQEEKVMPFVERELQRAENAIEVKDIASEMLQIAQKHKDKWPAIGGYLPEKFQRDPDIRRYAALANQLVVAKSNALRGVPTNFRTKLVQQGKIDLTQPYNTQIQGLKAEIKNADNLLEIPKTIEKVKEENGGRYPRDLAARVYGNKYISNKPREVPHDLPNASLYTGKKGIRDKETGIEYFTPDGINWQIREEKE